MYSIKAIEKALGKEIYMDSEMQQSISLWEGLYKDSPLWKKDDTSTLNLSSSIASEMARLVTVEMKSIISDGTESEDIETLNNIYQDKVLKDIKIKTEYACAYGGIIFKPYISDEDISVDFYMPSEFVPIRFDSNGQLVECVFLDYIKSDNKLYTKLEHHRIDLVGVKQENGEFKDIRKAIVINNYSFVKEVSNLDNESLGDPIPITEVEEWSNLGTEIIIDKSEPLFSYFKMPLANNVNPNSELGISVFAGAVDLIKKADIQWTRIDAEYDKSEKKIFVSEDMVQRDDDGKEINIANLVSVLDAEDPGYYKEFNPDIRDTEFFNGLEEIKRAIEFNCQLAYGTLSKSIDVAKTATEIKASKQRSYTTVADIQKSLQESLEHLVYAMKVWYEYLNDKSILEYEIGFDFDDSLVVDSETEQKTLLLEVQGGIRTPESYLKKMYGMTDEEIELTLPNTNRSLEGKETDEYE